MSVETLSIGNELKDSYKLTSKWLNNGINWLQDISDFYLERSALEKEYLTKLRDLSKKYFDKKARVSASLSVGDDPAITPGSLENASLVLWTDLLTQTEAIAEEKSGLSREFQTKIADNLTSLKAKCERVARQVDAINDYLSLEKQKVEDDVNKAKKHYDGLCQTTEAARDRNEKSPSDKHQRRLDEKQVAMNNGKNDYLIRISVANRLKDKYFYQDVPELLDYMQELNENRVAIMNKLLKNASIVERNSVDRVKEKLHLIDETIDQNNPKLDVAMFIKHNAVDWKEPQDFYFIPCSFWHDDESLIVKEPELTELKKKLSIASNEYYKFEQSCLDVKQKLEESTNKRKQDNEEITLKFDAGLQGSLSILDKFMKEDTNRVKNEVEIEIIQNFAGDKDLSYVAPVKEKKSRFGFLTGGSHKKSQSGTNLEASSEVQSLNPVKTSTSLHSGIFDLRRNKSTKSNHSGANGPAAGASASGSIEGKALYEYAATGPDEATMSAGDQFIVIEEDDGSGWTLIKGYQGQGLVPTSYIEITSRPAAVAAPAPEEPQQKKKGPAVAPRRGAKKVQHLEALYDYMADGEDELTIHAGDRIILVQDDTDGSGWTEGELNGQTGMFPTSYVKKI
ncbi:Protein BZZ1 [Candida viswanathii]|uniref:Protein BZZ1 n=1 Tax=Candida viswanathii TaxID=5486 RepID=A0A367XMR4_9ASCO|nr:Protein BZZ1 [Candida viswanathii]